MLSKSFVSAAFLVVFLFNFQVFAASEKAKDLAQKAVSENPAEAKSAVSELRALGAEGLNALFEIYSVEIKNYADGKDAANWSQIAAALDATAMQKDAYAAGLFWQTDFAEAKKLAKKENKPILSLRLLGNLNEELSCANSRFFRAVLYPNAEISKILRERYVLHWQSVRPVPKVTIDFGDGRKIERTLTGNSIHYVLDADGKTLDALPGLYSPAAFSSWLNESERLFKRYNTMPEILKGDFLVQFHRLSYDKIEQIWRKNLAKLDAKTARKLAANKTDDLSAQDLIDSSASRAANNAFGKKMVELSSVTGISLSSKEKLATLENETDVADWQKIAAFYLENSRIDANSRALIQRQTKADGAKLDKLISNFENLLAIDSARNEYVFRSKLHEWLAAPLSQDLDKFNDKVYAELFLTPKSDAWLGLYSPEIYAALENDGIK